MKFETRWYRRPIGRRRHRVRDRATARCLHARCCVVALVLMGTQVFRRRATTLGTGDVLGAAAVGRRRHHDRWHQHQRQQKDEHPAHAAILRDLRAVSNERRNSRLPTGCKPVTFQPLVSRSRPCPVAARGDNSGFARSPGLRSLPVPVPPARRPRPEAARGRKPRTRSEVRGIDRIPQPHWPHRVSDPDAWEDFLVEKHAASGQPSIAFSISLRSPP